MTLPPATYAAVLAGLVAADTTTNTNDPLSIIGRQGLLGALAVLLIGFAWRSYTKLEKRAEAAEERERGKDQLVIEKYVPALEATRAALETAMNAVVSVRNVQAERDYRPRTPAATPRKRTAARKSR